MKRFSTLLMLMIGLSCYAIDIPILNWQQRSDWISVKTNVPVAIGNGVADDTAALQSALNATNVGKTVYIPAGTYKITQTLFLTNNTAVTVIGNGKDTSIVWAGAAGGRMFVSDGNPYSRYIGLSWNGAGIAAVGFDHSATNTFETHIQHINEAYRNFTGYGIRVGNGSAQAAAEILYRNCLFANCTNGLGFLAFNDYDNTIDHCQFESCSNAVVTVHGNFYARDSHFQNSGYADFNFDSEHGSSIRRCTSTGSRYFAVDNSIVAGTTIQDCQVANWTDTGHAMHLSCAPVLMFDNVFAGGPVGSFPVESSFGTQLILISSNSPAAVASLITGIPSNRTYQITNGTKSGTLTNANQTFLSSTPTVPVVVFDAKVNFGAVGNGVANDTTAIQNTINAAKNYGQGAMAYIPVGSYYVSSTLLVTGTNYFVGGSGRKTCLHWHGTAGLPFMVVTNVQNVSVSDMGIGTHDCSVGNNGDDVLVTGPSACTVNLDGLYVYGKYDLTPDTHGLKLDSLPTNSIVTVPSFEGNIRITNCSPATLLFRTSYEGIVTLRGPASTNRVANFLTRLTTLSNPALQVLDNQSVTMSDYYIESSQQEATLAGSVGKSGAITIQNPKVGLVAPYTNVVAVNGYNGRIYYGSQFYQTPAATAFTSVNTTGLQLTFAGSVWHNNTNWFDLDGNTALSMLGNQGQVDDGTNATTMLDIGGALDDLRTLGQLDLSVPDAVPPFILAASCSQADIQAAIAASQPGGTVIVPAGTCAPTISILLTNQITLLAQGTILQDSIINTGDGANSSIIQVAVGPSPTNETRVTGFTFQTGSRATKLFDSGNIHLGGGANNVRIDHCSFLATQNIGIGGGDVFGVIDHNVFAPPGAFTQPMKLTHASYGGAANGYGSWALPSWTNSYHEDASAIYIENNFFTNSSGSSGLGIDGFGGARWVSRYNIYDRVIDGGHGTETTAQYAGCRLKDVYNNLFIEHGDSEPGHWRSGSGACVSNTVISCPNQFQARNYRGAFGGFYHYANATNAWDLNDATIYAAGSATAGGTLTMTDSGRAWTPSQWIGYTIRNVSSGQGSIINASTATTVSYAPPTEGANMAFTPGQTYQFRKVVTILDEVGRGQGSLRNNTLPAWPNQAVDPVYNWANTFDGASKLMDNGGYYTSVVGQEIINGPNANWLPYTYPHPLVGSSVAAVTITAQPHSTNVYASQTALFTITATGSPQPFTYQWTTNGVNSGTNGPALSVGPCPVAWSGMNVICVVANAAGFATSATATLTVLPDPVITGQPSNATVGVGSTASFSVTATGQTGLTYQWSKNGSSILGATHSSYVTPVTVSGDNNSQFFAVVTDTAGSLQSGNATLTVTNIISPPDPVITAQPQSTNIFATQPATFSITATGGTPLSYQWTTNGVNSGTTQTLTFPSCPVVWSGMTIVCVVTDVAGSVTSSIATLAIGADPVIATQPQNSSRFSGTTASFNVSATGQTAFTYQWSRNGVSVAGATQSAYTTPILTMANNGDAYCVDATDTAGTLRSANATLTVLPAPGGPTQIARVTTLRVGVTKAGP